MFALHLYHTTSKSYTLLFFYYMYIYNSFVKTFNG